MKLATLDDGTRDGRLVVVSADVTRFSDARHLAPTLQHALDNWARVAPHLDLIARSIETGGQPVERFHEREALAPLPRAYCWLNAQTGSATLRPGRSDGLLAPRAGMSATAVGQDHGVALGVAVILDDLAPGADRATALAAIRLVMLAATAEAATACSPVAVTPDELGTAWEDGVLAARLAVSLNGEPGDTGPAPAPVDLAALVMAGAQNRPLGAGSVLAAGLPETSTLRPGDTLRIEMRDASGRTIFGAIEQTRAPGA